jgi:hypothetical protein
MPGTETAEKYVQLPGKRIRAGTREEAREETREETRPGVGGREGVGEGEGASGSWLRQRGREGLSWRGCRRCQRVT